MSLWWSRPLEAYWEFLFISSCYFPLTSVDVQTEHTVALCITITRHKIEKCGNEGEMGACHFLRHTSLLSCLFLDKMYNPQAFILSHLSLIDRIYQWLPRLTFGKFSLKVKVRKNCLKFTAKALLRLKHTGGKTYWAILSVIFQVH